MNKPMDKLIHIGDEIEAKLETFKKQYEDTYGELPEEEGDDE
jgi:hypothetical protein